MNYELAKEMYLLGFAFRVSPDPRHGYQFVMGLENPVFVPPTLSELIEACPKKIDSGAFSLTFLQGKWFCGYEEYEMFTPECTGSTPEETVANLWLSLNKKSVV